MHQTTDYDKYRAGAIHWISYVVDLKYRNLVDEVCNYVIESKPDTILDIGCGDGIYTKKLIHSGIKTCGIDSSQDAIRLAIDHGVRHIFHGAIENFTFKVPYTAILLFDTLEHLKNPDKILKTIKKWCKELWILNPHPLPPDEKSRYHTEEWTDEELLKKLLIKGYTLIRRIPFPEHKKTLFHLQSGTNV